MSSLTKAQYIAELKDRSGVLSAFTDSTLGTFIDVALRAYSMRLPEVRVSINNAVVSGQELYDYPASALRIISLRDSDSRQEITFQTENQGSGDKIRPGSIMSRSYESLLEQGYYASPLSQGTGSGEVSGYTAFDVEYTILQTMATVKDTGLEAIFAYIEHLVFLRKEEEVEAGVEQVPVSIADRSSDGSSTTVSFGDTAKRYSERAEKALEKFNKLIVHPYGTRG